MNKLLKSNKNCNLICYPQIYKFVQVQLGRPYSQNNVEVTEEEIKNTLKSKFPLAQTISVEDVSGGCGAMFNIQIETNEFKGLSIPKQHRIVYDTLKNQIKNIHGLHLETKVP